MGECTPSPPECQAVSRWRAKVRARYNALAKDTYRRVDVVLLSVELLVPDERVLELEPDERVLVLELEPDERVLLLPERDDVAAGVRLVDVVPELRTRVVVVELPARVDVAGCDVD